eukprot:406292-Amphidinium_carterae.1
MFAKCTLRAVQADLRIGTYSSGCISIGGAGAWQSWAQQYGSRDCLPQFTTTQHTTFGSGGMWLCVRSYLPSLGARAKRQSRGDGCT